MARRRSRTTRRSCTTPSWCCSGPGDAAEVSQLPAGRAFASDTFAHCKVMATRPRGAELFATVGLADTIDDALVDLSTAARHAG